MATETKPKTSSRTRTAKNPGQKSTITNKGMGGCGSKPKAVAKPAGVIKTGSGKAAGGRHGC
jgi:hypothetical protein